MRFLLFLIYCLSTSLFALSEREGIEYQNVTTNKSQIVHILKIDPSKFKILPKHANNQAIGLETLDSLAREHDAIAAINGGYFHLEDNMQGLPAGILKIDDDWYGIAYTNRAAVGWSNKDKSVLIDRIQTKSLIKIKHQRFPLHAVNQPGSKDRAILFTPAFGEIADSSEDSTDLVIQNNKIVVIKPGGNTKIPKLGYVYSIGSQIKDTVPSFTQNDLVQVEIQIFPEVHANKARWEKFNHIVGGTPLLIAHHKIMLDPTHKRMKTPFAAKQRARTALGILGNGDWVFVVVEKNTEPLSVGMSLIELAHFMENLGCEQAINLDGGSSSSLYFDNKIQNKPEKKEGETLSNFLYRSIADGILVLEKKP